MQTSGSLLPDVPAKIDAVYGGGLVKPKRRLGAVLGGDLPAPVTKEFMQKVAGKPGVGLNVTQSALDTLEKLEAQTPVSAPAPVSATAPASAPAPIPITVLKTEGATNIATAPAPIIETAKKTLKTIVSEMKDPNNITNESELNINFKDIIEVFNLQNQPFEKKKSILQSLYNDKCETEAGLALGSGCDITSEFVSKLALLLLKLMAEGKVTDREAKATVASSIEDKDIKGATIAELAKKKPLDNILITIRVPTSILQMNIIDKETSEQKVTGGNNARKLRRSNE